MNKSAKVRCYDRKELIASLEALLAEDTGNAAHLEAPPVEHQAVHLRASPVERLRRTHPLLKVVLYDIFFRLPSVCNFLSQKGEKASLFFQLTYVKA